jgi:two-component system response regulator
MTSGAATPIEILLVEDNPGDVRLTREALRDAKVRNRLHVAPDGVAALAFLRQQGEHMRAPRPDLILLDLNLPRMTGRELLEEIKQDEGLKHILASYRLQANAYVAKPVALDRFLEVIQSIEHFWLEIVKLSRP